MPLVGGRYMLLCPPTTAPLAQCSSLLPVLAGSSVRCPKAPTPSHVLGSTLRVRVWLYGAGAGGAGTAERGWHSEPVEQRPGQEPVSSLGSTFK